MLPSNTRKFEICLLGGLGNQMFQYAYGLAMSKRFGRQLVLDTGWLDHPVPMATPRQYGLCAFKMDSKVCKISRRPEELSPAPFRQIAWIAMRSNQARIDRGRQPWPCTARLRGHWQSTAHLPSIEMDLRADFIFAHEPSPCAAAWIHEIRSRNNAVSIHVRRGDYVDHPGYPPCTPAYYREAAHRLRQKFPDADFFVVSDDPAWCSIHLPEFPRRVNGTLPDHEHLRIMSACRHHITANSTFSWWGAWLASSPGQCVIAPAIWHADHEMNRTFIFECIPEGWILQPPTSSPADHAAR